MSYLTGIPYYVYKVTHLKTGQYYYGSRYSHVKEGRLPADDLWVKYFTSSREVKRLIDRDGKQAFSSEILAQSTDKEYVYRLEQDLIKVHLNEPLCVNMQYVSPETNKFIMSQGLSAWSHRITQQVVYASASPGDDWVKGNLKGKGRKCYHKASGEMGYFHESPGPDWIKGQPPAVVEKTTRYGADHNAHRVWWNNGVKSVMRHQSPGPAWKPGRITWTAAPASDNRKRSIGQANSNRKYYNNGVVTVRVKDHPGPGWTEGKILTHTTYLKKSLKAKDYKHTLGMKWCNNGTEEGLFRELPGPDWSLGRLSNPGQGTQWYHNGVQEIRCKQAPTEEGWIKGRLMKV